MNISELKSVEIPSRLFVTGIGTDVGKSYVTGILAREIAKLGLKVITQKFIQTGNIDRSEDIEVHRRLMGIDMTPEDIDRTTAPVIYTYPCSPDLASRIDKRPIDFELIDHATERLAERYDVVLIEGAGGVMVPLEEEYLTIDYIRQRGLPVVVTYNGQLGSINHTLLTMQALLEAEIPVFALVYNSYFDKDAVICADTRAYMERWLSNHSPGTLHLVCSEE